MRTVRHFKKYANRKFYDVDRGAYASVREIAALVKRGVDVTMTCDRTGRDLTLEILARILYEEVRRDGKRVASGKPGVLSKSSELARSVTSEVSRLVRLF
jgi:polyhydroxyalkanoate synthesis regulator protein